MRSDSSFTQQLPIVLGSILIGALCAVAPGQTTGKSDGKLLLHLGEAVPPGCVAIIDGATVTEETFINEFMRAFGGPGRGGEDVRKNLLNENIVMDTMRKRGLSVADKQLQEKIRWIEKEVKKKGATLDDYLKTQGIPRQTFLRKLRSSIGLETLARMDLKLPDDKPVGQDVMNIWLMDHREKAVIVIDPQKLGASIAFTVNGVPVTKRRFVEDALPVMSAKDVRKLVIDPLVQSLLVERMLKLNGLALTEADVLLEWTFRKKAFTSDPANKGLPFEDIVRQQTGKPPEEFRKTPGFRLRASLHLIGRKMVTPADLAEGYEKNKSLYGPRYTMRHILIRATLRPDATKKMRSFEESEPIVQRIRQEATDGRGRRFEDLVRLYSEDLGTKYKGGLLPVFTPGNNRLVAPLVNAAMKMEVDTISNPIKTDYGWHILRLEAKEPAPSLAEVEGDLRRQLAQERFAKKWSKAKLGIDVRL